MIRPSFLHLLMTVIMISFLSPQDNVDKDKWDSGCGGQEKAGRGEGGEGRRRG